MAKRTQERIDFLASILVTAVEGGIDYWAEIRNYTFTFKDGDSSVLTDARAMVRINDDYGPQGDWMPLTIDTIARGINKIMSGTATYGTGTMDKGIVKIVAGASHVNDGCDIDASLADIIVQVAVLDGDVVYG